MLQHVKWAANQRVELGDMDAMGLLGLTNLARVVSAYFAPGVTSGRVVRGGEVFQTAPASKNVVIHPLAAVGGFGIPVILESEETKAIADNASGNPRIDLVSVSGTLANGDPASRKFWNPATEESFDATTNTRTSVVVTTTVTQGVPAATPSAPATPAGHVPLAYVSVANGMTSITQDNIQRADASFVVPVKTKAWTWGPEYGVSGNDANLTLPYESPDLMVLSAQYRQPTILVAQIYARFRTGIAQSFRFALTGTVQDPAPYTFELGRAIVVARDEEEDPRSISILGVLQGVNVPTQIRLSVRMAVWTGSRPVALMANALGPTAAYDQPVWNRLVAITL